MKKHKCRICGESKVLTEFDKNYSQGPYEAWNLRYCKICSHEKYLSRYTDSKQRETMQKASRNWKKEHPERHSELAREYRGRHPEKIKAQNKLNYAVRKGRIHRQPCEVCGVTEKIHAHHVSYKPEDWYNVKWLCYLCHKSE